MVTCRRCGRTGLDWEQGDNGKWFLTEDDGERHECEPVAGGRDRRGVYGAVDAMGPHELRELIGYAEQRLMELTDSRKGKPI